MSTGRPSVEQADRWVRTLDELLADVKDAYGELGPDGYPNRLEMLLSLALDAAAGEKNLLAALDDLYD